MRTALGSGDVGIWHETYQVPVADLETVYVDMPAFGLAAATTREPMGRPTARRALSTAASSSAGDDRGAKRRMALSFSQIIS